MYLTYFEWLFLLPKSFKIVFWENYIPVASEVHIKTGFFRELEL